MTMSNAAALRRIFSLMDDRGFAAIPPMLTSDFAAIMGGNPPMNAENWATMGRMFYDAFPDGRHTIHEAYEIGDRVCTRGSFTGTHTGAFMGLPPTGKKIHVTFLNLDRFVDGKLAEHRSETDMMGLLQQLGAIPS